MKSSRIVVMACLVLVAASSCSTVATKRIDTSKPTDLSGNWNDTDARVVAESMIKDCLEGQWINQYIQGNGGKVPVVIVGSVRNKTFEHIATDVFIDSLQKSLINSGRVKFVASKDERGEVREERKDQQDGNTEPSTITMPGHETGADFMLQGNINAVKDAIEEQRLMVGSKKSTSYYSVSLELINLKTNEKTWIGQKDVKKSVERSKVF